MSRRFAVAAALLLTAAPVWAATNPLTVPTQLDAAWQARTRSLFQRTVEVPSVKGRGEVPKVAALIAADLTAGGFPSADIKILPYEALPGDHTAALIFRWRTTHPTKRPLLILGHMDVVEAKRADWQNDPFKFIEKDGYFYGRGTSDMKNGLVATTMALLKLKAAGFKPNRDIILFFSGDEETGGIGATKGAGEWRALTDAEFGLNADGGNGGYDRNGRPLGFTLTMAEKTYQTFFFTTRNPGGHSSRPRPDNAIYDLADAIEKLRGHRFTPMLNDATRAYFTERAKDERGALGDAMRRWLANPADGAAADLIEADPLEVGRTRTRCVATMLEGGHADNALPQSAKATVNCRIMPGIDPKAVQAELQAMAGPKVAVTPDPSFIGVSTPASPLRADLTTALRKAVLRFYGPAMHVIPGMTTGASDGSFFRAKGIPVYDIDGSWGIIPDDERAHGLDERIPVRAMYDDVAYWEMIYRGLAG